MIVRNGLLVLVVILSSQVLFGDGKSWTMDAIMALKTISDPEISPDGSKVAYVVRSANFQRKAYDSQIWVVSTSGGTTQPLKSPHVSDGRPRWSRKGNQLAFVSRRDGRPQIYVVAPPDGEPRKLTASASGVGDFKWSPDDSHIGYLAVDPLSAEEKKRIQEGDDPIVANQGYRYSRLYQVSTSGGPEQRLTSDRHVTSFDWAPDGKKVVYSGQNTPRNRDTFHVDLFELDLPTHRETTLVAQEGRDAEPSYSPDGRWVAFHSQAGTINYFEERHVGLVPSGGGEIRYLTRNLPLDVFRGGNEFWWTKDGSELTFGAGAGTQDHLFTVRLKDGPSSKLIDSLAGPSAFSISANGQQVAFLKSSPSVPPRLYTATKAGAQWQERALVSVNPEIDSLPKVTAKTLRWKSKDGLEVEGVLRLPFDYQQGKRVPLLVELHGGPTGVALEGFPVSRTYPYQLFLQEGFAVLAPNFRGSSNYGGKFRLANIESQGFGDFDDVMTGIDLLVQQGIADPDRLGVMGWSYGGFLSAWILGHSDRFKAISIGAPGADWMSWYSRSDGPREVMWTYFGGKPWDHWENYNRHSPRYSLRYAKTPSLLLHGEEDIDDVAEIFQALSDLNVPVEFVTYPREGHGIAEPAHQRDLMRRNLQWFKQWVLKH